MVEFKGKDKENINYKIMEQNNTKITKTELVWPNKRTKAVF